MHAKLSTSSNTLFSISQKAEHEAKLCTQVHCHQPWGGATEGTI